MAEQPRPKSHDRQLGTLNAYQKPGQVIKPAELIEVRGGEKLSLAARRIYNQLLANAFGPSMADDGAEFRISFSELRGNHTSNDRVTEAIIALMRTVVRVRMTDGTERNVQLLGPTDIEKNGPGVATTLAYELHPKLLPILRDSQIYARLEMALLHKFSTKYGMALYEMVAKRMRLKHMLYEDFETDELRDYLGVPAGKLSTYGDFRRKAIEPAVEEVNKHAPFSCQIEVSGKKGRKVEKLRLYWRAKSIDELKAQYEARQFDQPELFDIEQLAELQIWESAE